MPKAKKPAVFKPNDVEAIAAEEQPKTQVVDEEQPKTQEVVDEKPPYEQEYEPPGEKIAEELSPMHQFEIEFNKVLREHQFNVPLPMMVGFMELKLIELKESYRLQIFAQLQALRENTHGNA